MSTEIELITRPACPPDRFKYKIITTDDPFPSLYVLEYSQFFFPKNIGMNKGDNINHEYSIKDKNIYWHIVVGKKGNRIVGEASNQFSISTGPIHETLQLTPLKISQIVNNQNTRSVKVNVYKNIYRELDRSGKQKNKEVSIGFCFSLTDIITELKLNHSNIFETLIK